MRYVQYFFFIFICAQAHIGVLKNKKEFEKALNQHSLLVILFYSSTHKENEIIQKTFAAVADMKQFLAARLPFRSFNIEGVDGKEIQQKYGNSAPFCIVLFRNALVYTSEFFHGPFDQKKVRKYIEHNLSDFITERVRERKNERLCQKKGHISVQSPAEIVAKHPEPPYVFYRPPYNNFCYNPWWYWDWPYGCYNNAPYSCYCRPAFGFGFSVGI